MHNLYSFSYMLTVCLEEYPPQIAHFIDYSYLRLQRRIPLSKPESDFRRPKISGLLRPEKFDYSLGVGSSHCRRQNLLRTPIRTRTLTYSHGVGSSYRHRQKNLRTPIRSRTLSIPQHHHHRLPITLRSQRIEAREIKLLRCPITILPSLLQKRFPEQHLSHVSRRAHSGLSIQD